MQPKIYICQTEGRSGSMQACFYLEAGNEIYGWRITGRGHRFAAAFFMLEDFYANEHPNLYRSIEDDVYGLWMMDHPRRCEEIRSPLPEPVRHELERIQSLLVQEWFFFENDPASEAEIAAYECQHLPVHAVNVKLRKLNRFSKTNSRWEYHTSGFNKRILEYVQKHIRANDILVQKWAAMSTRPLSVQGQVQWR